MIAKKIGIWGYGISGQSTVQFLLAQGYEVSLFDNKKLPEETIVHLKKNNVICYPTDQFNTFIENNEVIIPSPGINLTAHEQHQTKWRSDLDLFSTYYNHPIIAITGSVGKTSTTIILAQALKELGKKVQIGGNIGIGLCDLIINQNAAECAILEVSSFQLELCKLFAPSLSIWTNFYPNHLDRHETLNNYFKAKLKILTHQKNSQKALIPLSLFQNKEYQSDLKKIQATLHFFAPSKPLQHELNALPNDAIIYYFDQDKRIIKYQQQQEQIVCASLPSISYPDNWLTVGAAIDILGYQLPNTISLHEPLEHRLERIGSSNGIIIYNDSKSTIMESTIAAIKQLNQQPIMLLLGGVSKGINRSVYFKQLQNNNIKHIFCFGKEAVQLEQYAKAQDLPASAYDQLDNAVEAIFLKAAIGDQLLFSPGGASFDLFNDYKQRGNYFKELVKKRIQ